MARNTIQDVGNYGIIKDVKPEMLPPGAWSDGRNVRFERDRVYKMEGVQEAVTGTKSGLVSCGFVNSATEEFILYGTGTAVYSFDGTTENNITRSVGGAYSETIDNPFLIQSFNGLGLLNNGIDTPQEWDSSSGSNLLVALSNWDATWKAKRIRPYGPRLIALDVTEGATNYPQKLRWSHPAGVGTMPASWDETDPTYTAGEFDFEDTQYGILMDGLELGNRFMVYKEGAVWVLENTGNTNVFRRNNIAKNMGLTVKRSLVEIPSYRTGQPVHFFAGNDNFYINDGVRVDSIFEDVFRDEILTLKNDDNWLERSFACIQPRFNEMWFCIPQEGETSASLAFVLNYKNGTHSLREISGSGNIVAGVGVTFSDFTTEGDLEFDDGTLFDDGTGFADTQTGRRAPALLEASVAEEKLYYLDFGDVGYDGGAFYCYVIREGLPTIQHDARRPNDNMMSFNVRKMIDSVTIKMLNDSSTLFSVGTQEFDTDPTTWSAFQTSVAAQHRQNLVVPVNGRIISIWFSTDGEKNFELAGFDYNVEHLGEY